MLISVFSKNDPAERVELNGHQPFSVENPSRRLMVLPLINRDLWDNLGDLSHEILCMVYTAPTDIKLVAQQFWGSRFCTLAAVWSGSRLSSDVILG